MLKLDFEAVRALVNAVVRIAGERSSLIWEFSATSWSSLFRRSFIWEDWALIFLSFLIWDLEGASSSPDTTSMVDTLLVEALEIARWQVPRTCASSLQNSVNEHFCICTNKVLAIDALIVVKKLIGVPLLECWVEVDTEIRLFDDDLACYNLQFISKSFLRLFCLLPMAIEFC